MADDAQSPSGIPIAPVYRPEALDYERDLGDPGRVPYTRGVQPSMYRGRLWTMRQYAGFGTAQQTNARFQLLLQKGQTGLSVAFDLPTQMGIDSDSLRALGEVGRVGVAIDTVEDMHVLLDGIPLDTVSTSMTINATAATLLAMYVVVAEERGIARAANRSRCPSALAGRRRRRDRSAPSRAGGGSGCSSAAPYRNRHTAASSTGAWCTSPRTRRA